MTLSFLPTCTYSLNLECGADLVHKDKKGKWRSKKRKVRHGLGTKNDLFGRQRSKWSSAARTKGVIQSEITVS